MSKILVQSQFSRSAADYAVSPVHAKGRSLDRIVELADPKDDWQVLDVATGAGHTALAFAARAGHVVASDLTPKMLEVSADLAKERGVENVSFEEADAEAMPFEDNRFDCVASRIAPHHFPNIDGFISESARVLKPGGIFALVDNVAPDKHTTSGFSDTELQEADAFYNEFEKIRDPSHARALPLSEWLGRLDQAGFKIRHYEIMLKPMAFDPWVQRLNAGTESVEKLRDMANNPPPAAKAFLKPETRDDGLWLTWAECLVIAEAPQA